LVRWETERHFKKKGVELPPQLGALVTLACYPKAANQPAAEHVVKKFADFWACDPDLALEDLRFARKRRMYHDRKLAALCSADKHPVRTESERVRLFLVWNQLLLETRNEKGDKELHLLLRSV